MSGNIYWPPGGFLRGKRGFGSGMKRQENLHGDLFTRSRGKASRMRITVQLPSVRRTEGRQDGRTDVHLADNYNPLKANKRAIVLFQQEMSPIRRRLLLPRDWPADGGLPLRTTAWGLVGQRSEQGSLQSRVCCELCLRRIIRQLIYPGICSHPVGGRVAGVNQGATGRTLAPGEPLVVVSE